MSDLSPLSGLTRLSVLAFYQSQVEDLSPLSVLTSLQHLALLYSHVRELSPLLSLTSLRYLALLGNPLSQRAIEIDIPALEQRGVVVNNQGAVEASGG